MELVSQVGGNQSNADVQYYIQGPDLDKLAKYSDELLAKMKTIPGWRTPIRRCAAASRKCGWRSTGRARPTWAFR